MMKKYIRKFTLTELVVLLTVSGIMAAMVVPALAAAAGAEKYAACLGKLKQLAAGEQAYANDNDGYRTQVVNNEPYRVGSLKSARQLGLLYKLDYVTTPETFYCPDIRMAPSTGKVCTDPGEWKKDLAKDTYIGYWSANWYEKKANWEYVSFKLSGPYPAFTGWHASGRTPGSAAAMPLVMDFAYSWKIVNRGGLPHGRDFNTAFADGSAATYTDSDKKITSGDWHNIWLAPDVIMQWRDAAK